MRSILFLFQAVHLAEEEVDFSCRSLFVVVSFAAVAAVAVVAACRCRCRPVGGIAWFACGDGVLWSVVGGGGLRDLEPPTGLRMLKGPPVVLQLLCEL
jgi:hypothetical protein